MVLVWNSQSLAAKKVFYEICTHRRDRDFTRETSRQKVN